MHIVMVSILTFIVIFSILEIIRRLLMFGMKYIIVINERREIKKIFSDIVYDIHLLTIAEFNNYRKVDKPDCNYNEVDLTEVKRRVYKKIEKCVQRSELKFKDRFIEEFNNHFDRMIENSLVYILTRDKNSIDNE